VVDDGSDDAEAIAAVAGRAGASLLRLDPGRGAAAARNAGLGAVGTPFVAFVDSDCVVGPGFPSRLLDHLGDPALAVAVPRIVALEPNDSRVLARYEAHRSALDMGSREALIRPGSAVPYAPSAAMVARVSALGEGFAPELRMGEDVDLLWRLIESGWQVRYDPAVTVAHDHRVTWRGWLARRLAYNLSTATLARRHPGKVPALILTRGGAVFWAAVALGRPAVAAGACAVDTAALARALHRRVPRALRVAAELTARGRLQEGRHLARALTGPWLPFLIAATAVAPRASRRMWAGVAVAAVAERIADRAAVSELVPALADDLARCAGIWAGCVRERRIGALLPRIR
jgi:mycofactocin system glycosyltransferase